MTKNEEKAWLELRKHRDALDTLASETRTSFFTKEEQPSVMKIAEALQNASNAIDLEMLKFEADKPDLNEVERLRMRFLKRRF